MGREMKRQLPVKGDIMAQEELETTQGTRTLVVEDETLIRLDIVETLEAAGYEVVGQAGDGEQAIAPLRSFSRNSSSWTSRCPVSMASSAADRILENQNCAIVMLTAFFRVSSVDRARDAGAMAYVVKPFTPAELIPAVEIAVSRAQELAALKDEVASLTEQFETRKRVDRAKGLLEERMGLSEPEAFRWIQKTSMDRRLTMREVADAVIEQVGPRRVVPTR